MPAMLVHYCFAEEKIPAEEKKYANAVRLGSQGPDPFFYFGIAPWKRRTSSYKDIVAFGEKMHHTDIAPIYCKMIKYALKSPDKNLLLAYIDGLFMHYSVDKTLHPYIFAESGFDAQGLLTGYYKWSHGAYEALLDVQVGKMKGNFFKPSKALKDDKEELKKISMMWAEVSEGALKEDSFVLSCQDYKTAMDVLWSPTGIKRAFFRLGGKHSLLMGMSYPHHIKKFKKMDQLNESHREWVNCITGKIRNESFADLWNRAGESYSRAHDILSKAIEGQDEESALSSFVSSIDHDGFPIGAKKLFYGLCWKRIEK